MSTKHSKWKKLSEILNVIRTKMCAQVKQLKLIRKKNVLVTDWLKGYHSKIKHEGRAFSLKALRFLAIWTNCSQNSNYWTVNLMSFNRRVVVSRLKSLCCENIIAVEWRHPLLSATGLQELISIMYYRIEMINTLNIDRMKFFKVKHLKNLISDFHLHIEPNKQKMRVCPKLSSDIHAF